MKKIKVVLILLVPVGILIATFYALKSIKISEVACRSQYGECSSVIKSNLDDVKNCDFLTCRQKIDKILADSFIVDRYTLRLKLPLRIEVDLLEKKPLYSVRSLSENLVAQTDADGFVLDIRDVSNLPGISVEGNLPQVGEKVSSEEFFALEVVYGVSKIQEVKSAHFENDIFYIELENGLKVIMPKEADRDFILGAFTLILNELKKENLDSRIDEGQITEIDLRYNNPILR